MKFLMYKDYLEIKDIYKVYVVCCVFLLWWKENDGF